MCYKDKSPAMDPSSTSFRLIRILTDSDSSTHDQDPGNRIPRNLSLESLGSSGFWDLVSNGETVRKTPRNIARTPIQKTPAQPLVMNNLRKRGRKSVIVGLPAPSRFPGSYQSDATQTSEDLQNLQPSIRVSRMASENPRPHQCGKGRSPPKGSVEVENSDFSRVDKSSKATSDQDCRPSGRMRGSLSGRACANAFSQYIIQPTQVKSPSATIDPPVNPFSSPSGSTGAAKIPYMHAPTLANQPTQVDAEVCVEPELSSCESEQENTDGNSPMRVQAEKETKAEAAKPGLCRIIRDDDEKKKKKKVAREELGLSCQSGLTTEHLNKTIGNVDQVIHIANRDGSFRSAQNINHVPKEVESILCKRALSAAILKTEKPKKHHSAKVVQERFVCRPCNQMQVDAEECWEDKTVKSSATENVRENGACGQEGHMKINKNCPRYGQDADIQVVESSGMESLSKKRNCAAQSKSVNCIKDMQEIVERYTRIAREDEKADILRVEQATKAAHEKLLIASRKRKRAQILWEYADLLAERAIMAFKIAQAAQ